MFEFLFGKRNKPAGTQPAEPKPVQRPPVKVLGLEDFNPPAPQTPASKASTTPPPAQPAAESDTAGGAGAGKLGPEGASAGKPSEKPPERKPSYFGSNSDPDSPLCPHFFSPKPELLGRSPRVLISPEAYKRMLLYVEIAQKEVGWLGTVTRLANGDFHIDATFLIEQEVTSVETELSVEGLNKLVFELMAKGDEGLEQVNRLRFWGHSHVRMGTSPSGTDERTMDRFGSEGLPWYVRGIFNKLGRGSFTIYFYELGFRINDAPWAVWSPEKGVLLDGNAQSRFGGTSCWPTRNSEPGYGGYSPFGGTQSGVPGLTGENAADKAGSKPGPQSLAARLKHLPPELVPSDELRAAVADDFLARVSERSAPVFKWFKWTKDEDKDKDEDGVEQADIEVDGEAEGESQSDKLDFVMDDLDGNPGAGSSIASGAKTGAVKRNESDAKTGSGKPPAPKKSWSFWDWLFGSNSTPEAPAKPPVKLPVGKSEPKAPDVKPWQGQDNKPSGPKPDGGNK